MTASNAKKPLHEVRFPGESDQYRRARDELVKAEIELRRQIEGVAAQRRKLPLGGPVPRDYTFEEWDAGASGMALDCSHPTATTRRCGQRSI